MNERVIKTIGEVKALGIWSEVCKREQWNEEFFEGKLSDDLTISIDVDLLPQEKGQ